MAFPFIFEENFELGTLGDFDSETDTGSLLDFVHYSTLSKIPGLPAPYRGAYCMRIVAGDTNDHTLTEGSIDIADGSTAFIRFYLYVAREFTATADDTFNIFEFQQAGGTVEASLGMRVTAASNLLEIGIGDGTAPTSFVPFTRGRWTCVEVGMLCSTADVGTLTLYIDGASVIALATLDNAAAIGQGVLGTQDTLSTTTGTLLFDQFACDDLRIYPISVRYPMSVLLTKSAHVFVGAGKVENVTLLSGAGTDCVLSIFDTDVGSTLDATNARLELKNVMAGDPVDPAGVPVVVQRGCFVQLSGTNPCAMINVGYAQGYWSDGRIKQHGARRIPAPGGF